MGALQLLHDDAMLVVPGIIVAVVTAWLNSKRGWFGHPKTRRLNSEEHMQNAAELRKAVAFSRLAAATSLETKATLEDHIDNHPAPSH